MSHEFTWKRRNRLVRVRLPRGFRPHPKHRWAVCTGAVDSPRQRCLWQVVQFVAKRKRAEELMAALPSKDGRAIVALSREDLVFVDDDGISWPADAAVLELLT